MLSHTMAPGAEEALHQVKGLRASACQVPLGLHHARSSPRIERAVSSGGGFRTVSLWSGRTAYYSLPVGVLTDH